MFDDPAEAQRDCKYIYNFSGLNTIIIYTVEPDCIILEMSKTGRAVYPKGKFYQKVSICKHNSKNRYPTDPILLSFVERLSYFRDYFIVCLEHPLSDQGLTVVDVCCN